MTWGLIFAGSEVGLGTIGAAVIALIVGVGGTLGAVAKNRDRAIEVYRTLSDAYKADNERKDVMMAELRAERAVMAGEWLKSLSKEIGQVTGEVVGKIVAEELRKHADGK